MLKPGHILKNRYVIEKHLGKGGMGSVYLATDQTFGSKVALKETIVQGLVLEEAFEREARVLNKLRHGAIPVVMDYFTGEEGSFLVMQYIPGDDLSTLLERTNRPFPVDLVLAWADQLLDALTYLHTQNPPVIHRDIKPQNLKLTDRDEIVLLDFGLSKVAATAEAGGAMSVSGYTPSYAPIEQIQCIGTDARSDLYSLGATLYHLLTGVRPDDVLRRIVAKPDPLEPLYLVNPAVSKQVSDVIMSALAIDAKNRPKTAAEMRLALRGAAFDDLLALAHGGFEAAGADSNPVHEIAAAAAFGDLPTLIPSYADASHAQSGAMDTGASAASSSAVADTPSDDSPTVVTYKVPGFDPDIPPPSSPQSSMPSRERNTKRPSTVSSVFETVTLDTAGDVEAREKRRAKQYFESAGQGESITLIEVPAGAFLCGSSESEDGRDDCEEPQSQVTIGRLFVSRSPITQAQWRAVATGLPSVGMELKPAPSQFQGDHRPVETVSWLEAKEFCNRLSAHSGREYRLPSEAEWEYLCRAGTTTPFGLGATLTVEVANVDGSIGYGDSPSGTGRAETVDVESYGVANRFGLFDMHGNVWEWTEDRWHETLDGLPPDGSAWLDGGEPTIRVLRGGAWTTIPHDARSAKRFSYLQTGRRNDIGFRIVMVPHTGG